MPTRPVGWGPALAAVLALLFSACAPGPPDSARRALSVPSPVASDTPAAGSGTIGDRVATADSVAGPPAIVLSDTSPGRLAVSLHLTVWSDNTAYPRISELGIGFSSQGRPIQFVADEGVVCNGAAAHRGGGIFDLKVPTDTFAGQMVTCTYTSGQASATIAFTAPPALAILAPLEHAQVARSTHTIVKFRVGGQSTTFYVIALGPSSKAWSYPAGATPTETAVDTSRFPTGPGFIALSQSFALPDLHWTGFESVEGRGQAFLQYAVTWV